MGYCLVGNISGKLEPINDFHRKYDAVEMGLSLLVNKCSYTKQQRFNGITQFEVWTDEIQTIDYVVAKYWYLLGYEHSENSKVLKAKDFGIKNSSLEYGCYDYGVLHSRLKQWHTRYF